MKEESFDFFQDHSAVFLEMAFRADRMEPLPNPDAEGRNRGDCGDTVTIWLKTEGEEIRQAALRVEGCLHTVACANAVAELVEGKPVAEAWKLTAEGVTAFLETLPPGHYHCAELAVGALYRALADLQSRRREPWKSPYRRSRPEPGGPASSGSEAA
ncbi:MAG: iron-sulfur cluster assembly scaffold protein [Desulfobacterales bacterium]